MKRELFIQLKNAGEIIWDSSYPGGAWYYAKWDEWYNNSGQQLRHAEEYNQFSEGYTPFGDE